MSKMKLLRQSRLPQPQVRADEAQQLQRVDRQDHQTKDEQTPAFQRRRLFLCFVLRLDHTALEYRSAEEQQLTDQEETSVEVGLHCVTESYFLSCSSA